MSDFDGDTTRSIAVRAILEAPFLPLAIASTRAAEVQRAIAPNDGSGADVVGWLGVTARHRMPDADPANDPRLRPSQESRSAARP
jgi:hypothetical protein